MKKKKVKLNLNKKDQTTNQFEIRQFLKKVERKKR